VFRRHTVTGPLAPGPSGLLVSPLTGRECVWYRLRVESWQARADPHHRETVCLVRRGDPFRVMDTLVGADLIRGAGAPVEVVAETVVVKRPPTREQAPLLHALVDQGFIPEAALNRRAHLLDELVWETSETLLQPGRQVSVSGRMDRLEVLRHSLLTGSRFAPATLPRKE
jgi:hypothetical protein